MDGNIQNITQLPNEMLHRIARQLDARSLLRLAQVSHLMLDVASGVEPPATETDIHKRNRMQLQSVEDQVAGEIINNLGQGKPITNFESTYLMGKINELTMTQWGEEPNLYVPGPIRDMKDSEVSDLHTSILANDFTAANEGK